jgi:hypothetical protein
MSPSDRPKPPNTGQGQDGPDPDAPPSEDELRAAETLRRVLEGQQGARGQGDGDALRARELVQSIRAAVSPGSLSRERHRAILDRALGADVARDPRPALERRGRERAPRSKVAYLALGGAASVLALAAAIALVIRSEERAPSMTAKASAAPRPALALARSTSDLFSESFPRSGKTTDRVDRIAYARAQDLRENRFARWGTP